MSVVQTTVDVIIIVITLLDHTAVPVTVTTN